MYGNRKYIQTEYIERYLEIFFKRIKIVLVTINTILHIFELLG